MKAEIAISPDGKVTVVTREGTFAGGTERLSQLIANLRKGGIEVEDVRFEQHRHDCF
ncbi:hypothetical protein [Desulfotruncus alcoholivorax]|uniref:hypothetical protein n=1 Tax=Desulfotruncus alcoholivorax TaxID=265477 RepID=UPI00040CAD6B|nr:hypothetical protein [Desulfotruncus alcoholivorax]